MINYNLQCIYCGPHGKMKMAVRTLHGIPCLILPVFGILDSNQISNACLLSEIVGPVQLISVSFEPELASLSFDAYNINKQRS